MTNSIMGNKMKFLVVFLDIVTYVMLASLLSNNGRNKIFSVIKY